MQTFNFRAVSALVFLSILASNGVDAAQKCAARTIGDHDSFVCVCNQDFCDTVDPVEALPGGIIQIWETTRAEKRFEKRAQIFNDDFEPPAGYPWSISVNRTGTKYQEILGFGGAFSDAAVLNIGSFNEKVQEDILQAYFGDSGIEYSVGRVVISGSDFSNRKYSYDDEHPYDWDLVYFKFVEEDTDYKIPQLLRAKEIAGEKLKYFASSWSPPAWLKSNNEINHGGSLNEEAGSRSWQTYAKYLVKFFDGYKAAGIDFWGMTVQNEVAIFDEFHPWNTCGFTAEMERDFVKTDLGPIMEEAGYTPENFNIMVLDHNRDLLPYHSQVILSDEEASKYVKGTAVHWYGNTVAGPSTYDRLHELFPDKFIFATEACTAGPPGDRAALGSFAIGEEYAHDIIRDLTHWVTGWTDWNLALDMEGGVNWVQNFQSAPVIANPEAGEWYKNPSFYAMGHFSKFLPPGSVRIQTTPEIVDNERFQTGAFLRPDGGVVFIAINSWDENQTVTIKDSVRGQVKINVESHSFNTYLYY